MNTWLIIAGVALTTFLLRASFIVFADPQRFPGAFRRSLAYVPPAVLAAIVAPGLILPQGVLDFTLANARLRGSRQAVACACASGPIAAGLPVCGSAVAPGVKIALFAARNAPEETPRWANSS